MLCRHLDRPFAIDVGSYVCSLVLDRWLVHYSFWPRREQLGYIHHCKNKTITYNGQLVHPFSGNRRSERHMRIFSAASMVCNVLVQSCNYSIRQIFANFVMEASMFALIAMIAERYLAIVYPLEYVRVVTTKRIMSIIVMSWLTPAILSVFRWMYELYYNRLSIAEGACSHYPLHAVD